MIHFYDVIKFVVLLGIVQGGVKCGDEYLPGLFTRLTDPDILHFVQKSSGLIHSKWFLIRYSFNNQYFQ